jgi:hypothetical protein
MKVLGRRMGKGADHQFPSFDCCETLRQKTHQKVLLRRRSQQWLRSQSHKVWSPIRFSVLPPVSFVASGKLLKLAVSQIPSLWSGKIKTTFQDEGRVIEIIQRTLSMVSTSVSAGSVLRIQTTTDRKYSKTIALYSTCTGIFLVIIPWAIYYSNFLYGIYLVLGIINYLEIKYMGGYA